MKTLLLIFAMSSLAYGQWSWAIDPTPQLAPKDCPCVDCTCDPCKCGEPSKPVVSVKKVHTPAEASVMVSVKHPDGTTSNCSGTAICDHTVITCWHCLREGVSSVTVDGKPATVERSDKVSDVAIIRTEHQLKPVPVASKAPAKSESVTAYGYEYNRKGLWKFPSRINAINRYRGFPNVSIFGRPQSGRSGGGLFNSAGELVGVCSAADGSEGLYAGHAAVQAIVAAKTTPFLLQEPPAMFMQDPACKTGTCPLIKRQAPAKALAAPKVESRPAPIVSPGLYYTPRRWGRR
jgi:CBS domain-containing protein